MSQDREIKRDSDLRGSSWRWANWMSLLTPTTCQFCVEQHGKIYSISILKNKKEVQAHRNCKCMYVPMRTKVIGTVTDLEYFGADVYIAIWGSLPEYYVDKKTAEKAGWKPKKVSAQSFPEELWAAIFTPIGI